MSKSSPDIIIPGLVIDKKIKKAAYKQLYEKLQSLIINGQLRPNERLPSSRTLAEDLRISRNIVMLAYEQLALEGYISSAVGTGSYVAGNIEEIFVHPKLKAQKNSIPKKAEQKNTVRFNYPLSDNFIKRESSMSSIIPFENPVPAFDEFPYKSWVKCAYKVFRGFEFLHLGYDDPKGHYALRESIATYLRTNRALQCEPGQIVITVGTQQALNLIADILLKPNDFFWMEDPGYGNAKGAFMKKGAKPCFVPITKQGMDVEWAIKNCPKAAAVYVTPSHQFPLGGTLPVSKRMQLLNWAGKANMWVIEDDYDSEFRYSKKPIPSLQGLDQHKKVIYLGTFSKVLFPALRIGYMVLPSVEMADSFAQAKAFSDRQNSITDQAIVQQFMEEGYFYTHLRKMRFLYKKRQDHLVNIIEKYGKDVMRVEKQNSGMHLVGWLHEKIDDQDLTAYLEKAKVTVTPLSFYYGKFKAKPGLLLGYTGFNEKKLKEGALIMIEAIKHYMVSRKIAKL